MSEFRPADDVTGFVMAGGRSLRMGEGKDKAMLDFGGQSLLERAISIVSAVTPAVRIVGPLTRLASYGTVVEDIRRGPLGGIHAGLRSSGTDLNLVLAVDMPLMEAHFLKYLISKARESRAMVTIPISGARFQPLCAVYRLKFAEIVQASLLAGENKIDALFADIETRTIEETELVAAGFSPDIFTNVNTPADLERARQLIKSKIIS
ncbi:MAG: molybdenum cofactor guanylyltransferase [Acidobacteriota bacterium]|nr:molybdenum cofactor guanylyltransferase [Acidobacteriota bacterium]